MNTNKPRPLVSAIITTFNRPQLLPRALESVLGQTYSNVEVIVVVDGPDPATIRLLSTVYVSRIQVITLPSNIGISAARNIGSWASKGEWIAFLDDDDEWLLDKLAIQVRALEDTDTRTNFVAGRYEERGEGGSRILPRKFPEEGENWSESFYRRATWILPSTYLVKRSLMLAFPFRKDMRRHGDVDWLLRTQAAQVINPLWINDVVMVYHCETSRLRISSRVDWESRYEWYLTNAALLTKTSVPYYIGMFCIPEAKLSDRPVGACLFLLREAVKRGRLSAGAVVYLLITTLTSQRWRTAVRRRHALIDKLCSWREPIIPSK